MAFHADGCRDKRYPTIQGSQINSAIDSSQSITHSSPKLTSGPPSASSLLVLRSICPASVPKTFVIVPLPSISAVWSNDSVHQHRILLHTIFPGYSRRASDLILRGISRAESKSPNLPLAPNVTSILPVGSETSDISPSPTTQPLSLFERLSFS